MGVLRLLDIQASLSYGKAEKRIGDLESEGLEAGRTEGGSGGELWLVPVGIVFSLTAVGFGGGCG